MPNLYLQHVLHQDKLCSCCNESCKAILEGKRPMVSTCVVCVCVCVCVMMMISVVMMVVMMRCIVMMVMMMVMVVIMMMIVMMQVNKNMMMIMNKGKQSKGIWQCNIIMCDPVHQPMFASAT